MPMTSGYQPLIDYLAAWEGASLVLTLERIEEIIDAALPPTARDSPGWWTRTRHTPARLWRSLGWRASYRPGAGSVRFTRDAGGGDAAMTGHQAAWLRPGMRIRRKGAADDAALYTVERVEARRYRYKDDVLVHASGHAFRPWEIERADPRSGWPKAWEAT